MQDVLRPEQIQVCPAHPQVRSALPGTCAWDASDGVRPAHPAASGVNPEHPTSVVVAVQRWAVPAPEFPEQPEEPYR